MVKKHLAGKRALTILISAGLSLMLFACQIEVADVADLTNSPQSSASPTPTATEEQTTDPATKVTPDGSEDTAEQAEQNDLIDTDSKTTDDAAAAELSNGTGAYTITADTAEEGKNYTSESPDENALRVENGCTASADSATIEKRSGDTSSSTASQTFGLNAAMLLHDGTQLTLTGSDITSEASGASGAFAYGVETYLLIEDTSVRTNADGSFGIVAADGAIIAANSLTVSTQGDASAAVCVGKTGGSIAITSGTFTTGGLNSPAVCSVGSVSAQNATFRANHSAAIEVESGGSVAFNNCTVSGNMTATSDNGSDIFYTVLLWNNNSGIGDGGQSTFTMTGGLLNANNGDLFYVMDVDAVISLTNVTLSPNNGVLLHIAGTDGQNGGTCSLTVANQILNGDILVDEVSSLQISLTDGSSYTGSVNPDGTDGDAYVTLDDGSTWILTGDAYLTGFSGKTKNIETNGYTVYVNGSAIAS